MRYLNIGVFLGLIIFVAGCQKKDEKQIDLKLQQQGADTVRKEKTARRGATKLETKKSVAAKQAVADKIFEQQKASI